MRDILFISPENVYERTPVHKNVDSKMVVPVIKVCQEIYILPLLGTDLYDRLQDGIDASDLTALETTLLQDYVRDCLIYHTVAELADHLTYQFWNKGVMKKQSDLAETVPQSELFDIKNKYKNFAEYYGQRLMKYLVEEAGRGNFTQYNNPGNRFDTVIPKKNAYNTGIYLGNCNKNTDKPSWYNREFITGCNDC